MNFNTAQEAQTLFELAFGRLLRIGSRPAQDGDVVEYEHCKWVCYNAAEYLGIQTEYSRPHDFVRDYYKIHHD
jgi:hypothetical protein